MFECRRRWRDSCAAGSSSGGAGPRPPARASPAPQRGAMADEPPSETANASLMFEEADPDALDPSQMAAMRAVFDVFDASGDGQIQAAEVGSVLRRLQLIKSRRMVQTVIGIVDIDGDGEISFPEFVTLMARVKQEVEAKPEDETVAATAEGDEPPASVLLTQEEKQAKAERQAAMFAFQRAVTMMAFTHLAKDDDKMMAELLEVLNTEPLERSEWDLQRLLMWAENYDPEKTGHDVGFKFILDLPPPEESDVRIEVCRCMTVERFEQGKIICQQGDQGECMYVIMLGEVEVLLVNEGKEEHVTFLVRRLA